MFIRLILLVLVAIGAMTAWRWIRTNILSDGPALPKDGGPEQVPDGDAMPPASDLVECKACERYVPLTDSGNCPRCGVRIAQ